MNLLTKKKPWVAASLLAAASVFGQQGGRQQQQQQQRTFDQGYEVTSAQMMSGYNAPARIDVRGAWDFYAQGSFTYWQAMQENMELGIVMDVPTGPISTINNASIVNMDFEYKPGFKVGLGMNFDPDNWDGLVQYTWFRGTNSVRTSLDPTDLTIALFPLDVPFAVVDGNPLVAYFSGYERWRLAMDLLDFELARSEYVGTKLTFRPFFGARAAWIRQKKGVAFTDNVTGDATGSVAAQEVFQRSNSWALGPRAGLQTNWLIGQGFRLFGNGSGDILYTRYTKLVTTGQVTRYSGGGETDTTDISFSQKKYGTLRTHLELEFGIGWGTYFDNNNWHVDLSAGYGFQVFFNQNPFRYLNIMPNGNLYVQGLTTTVRFDF